MTAEQVAAIQLAEINLKAKAQELGLDFAKLSNDDRASARDMQKTVKSWVPPTLAIAVTVGFFGILAAMMSGKIDQAAEVDIMLGSLGTAWTGIIAFYFGSSASSQDKDHMIHNSTPINK